MKSGNDSQFINEHEEYARVITEVMTKPIEIVQNNDLKASESWLAKLYLNIATRFKKKGVRQSRNKPSRIRVFFGKLKQKFQTDAWNDFKDVAKFTLIHGLLGVTVALSLLTVTNVDVLLVDMIKSTPWATALVYLLGAGSGYYLFLDINKALHEQWRKNK